MPTQTSVLNIPLTTVHQADVKPHPKYRNIIFDLGGVLIYFNRKELLSLIFKDEPDYPENLAETPLTREWLEMDRGFFSAVQVSEALSDRYPKDKVLKFIQSIPAYLNPLEEGLEIVRAVKKLGYKTYVLSNLSQEAHEAICKHHDFFSQFDGTIFSYQVHAVKPDAEVYDTLLKTYNLTAEECLFIDDLEVNIAAGKALNIDGIVCDNHTHVVQELRALKVLD